MSKRRDGPRTGADGGSGPILAGTPLHRLLETIAREVAAPASRPTEGPGAG
jgi:hypothetical protein